VEPWEREQRVDPVADRRAKWTMRLVVALWVVGLTGAALLVVEWVGR
jgi:hypothetical protein